MSSLGPLNEGEWYTVTTTTSQIHAELVGHLTSYHGEPILLSLRGRHTFHVPWCTILSIRSMEPHEVLADRTSSDAVRRAAQIALEGK